MKKINYRQFVSQFTGFTLIELLIVILIIAILTGLALPQYQKAVEKSRAMEAVQLLKTVNQAVDAYHLATNNWPQTFDELAIDMPWAEREVVFISQKISDVRSNGKWSLQLEGNNAHAFTILASRLDGKYKSGSFVIIKKKPATGYQELPLDRILCEEVLQGNAPFTAPAGSFCSKLMDATLLKSFAAGRAYLLPF